MKYNYYTLEEAIALLKLPAIEKLIYCDHVTYSVFRDTLNMLDFMYTQESIDKSDVDLAEEALRLMLYYDQYGEIADIIGYDAMHHTEEDYEPKVYVIPED